VIEKLNREILVAQPAIEKLKFATIALQGESMSHDDAANANIAATAGGAHTRK
jgi:hypothetical protein